METQIDVLILVLWEIHTEVIIDIIFGDLDKETYRKEPIDKLLALWDKENKDKHGKHCHGQHNFLLYLSSQRVACLVRRPLSYS